MTSNRYSDRVIEASGKPNIRPITLPRLVQFQVKSGLRKEEESERERHPDRIGEG